jgi:molecular chaperone GrpE (heat shock protein)
MAATPTVNAIQASASRHAELVRGINELDYAKPALAQCSAYLKDLQTQVKRSEADLKRLAKSTEKERAEHIELKKSLTRKWSSKLVGRGDKYEKKVTKEEK